MPALGAGIHAFLLAHGTNVDGRDKPGHDDVERLSATRNAPPQGYACGELAMS